jgi:hypothetical protein
MEKEDLPEASQKGKCWLNIVIPATKVMKPQKVVDTSNQKKAISEKELEQFMNA